MEMEKGSASSYARILCGPKRIDWMEKHQDRLRTVPFRAAGKWDSSRLGRLSSEHREKPPYGVIRWLRSTRCKKEGFWKKLEGN